MDVVPSANYKKLLNEFSHIQNSSDIIEEDEDDKDQFFEIDEVTNVSVPHRHIES